MLWQIINRSPGRHFRSPWLAARDLFVRWNLLWLTTCQSLMSRLQSVARFNSVCVEKDHFSFDPFGSFGSFGIWLSFHFIISASASIFPLFRTAKIVPEGVKAIDLMKVQGDAGRCREVFVVMSCHVISSYLVVLWWCSLRRRCWSWTLLGWASGIANARMRHDMVEMTYPKTEAQEVPYVPLSRPLQTMVWPEQSKSWRMKTAIRFWASKAERRRKSKMSKLMRSQPSRI